MPTAFEEFVVSLTSRFTGLTSEELEPAIRATLSQLLEFLKTERTTLLEVRGDPPLLFATYSQARGEIVPFGEGGGIDTPYVLEAVLSGVPLILSRLPDDLPEQARLDREFSEREGFRSNVTVPILVAGRFTYAIASGTFSDYRNWTSQDVIRIRTVGQLIVGALLRLRSERKLLELSERLEAENQYLREDARGTWDVAGVVGKSAALRQVLDHVSLVAPTDAAVLLLGETGTGKELMANAIHDQSGRRGRPFVKVNCAAIPSTLVESELFGHERGAFTGATSTRIGRFELADGGTLLLDEVGDLPMDVQSKILRVLQDGRFERVGSTTTRHADVRIIAATNRDLEASRAAGQFREDLYYRLSAFPIRVPPLRDRREDIPLLVWSYVQRRQSALGRRVARIPKATMHRLQAYDWPGNIRELENVLERAMILSPPGELRVDGLLGPAAGPADRTLAAVERAHIANIIEQAEWRINGPGNAAEVLGLHPNTLRFRMKKLGIKRPAKRKSVSRMEPD